MTDLYDNYRIYRFIDAPNKTLIWEHDKIFIFLFPCLIGMWASQLIIGAVAGLGLSYLYKKLEECYGRGAIFVLQYWYLFQFNSMSLTPPSHKREFIG